ncbi:MAG: TonB-dependent receptor [Kordiimonadaceae bacterium]|nr:TonB-dependent receptor [Kordiimonadaceae bacterium]MBO6567364.1 TonB-dependent receptor [Kordiimonadaceae bacterium]MBO6963422.1 TonB-dependent receptor [Kordiimonadaceae bacterium]
MLIKRLLSTTAVVGLATTVNGFAVSAQEAAVEDELALEEIIVTARKRSENLRDVPLAITAFTAEAIQRSLSQDVQDLALLTPGFSFREGFGRATGGANNRPSVRGMSNILGSPNASFFVDGVYVAGPITSYDLNNVQRVEVVRGPQSALFGRGTFSGAINFITSRPGNEFRGRVAAEAGDHDHYEIRGFVQAPVIEDKLAIELSGSFYTFGGDYINNVNGRKELGDEETKMIGGKINWTPSDNLSVYIDAAYSEDRDRGFAYGLWNGGDDNEAAIGENQINCFEPDLSFFIFAFRGSTRSRGYYCGEIDSFSSYYYDLSGTNGETVDGVRRDSFRINSVIDYDFNGYTLTSLTGYTDFDFQNAFGAVNPGGFASFSRGSQSYFSEELRLASPDDQRLRWLIGGYYYKDSQGDNFSTSWDPLVSPAPVDSDVVLLANDSFIRNVAVFGSLDYDIMENLVFSAELRWQEETLHLAGAGIDNPLTAAELDAPDDLVFDATLPRFALRYDVNEDFNFYASVARGNKPGGFNSAFFDADFDATDRANFLNDGKGTFEESKVWSYELGSKGSLLDGRLRYDASVYYLDWTAQPLTTSEALQRVNSTAQSTVAPIVNAGTSEVKGFEIEMSAAVTQGFDLRVTYAYSDAQFEDYIDENFRDLQDTNGFFTGPAEPSRAPDADNDGVVDTAPGVLIVGTRPDGRVDLVDTVDPSGQTAGNQLPQTPKHMLTISPNFVYEVNDRMNLFMNVDYQYESKRFVQAANLAFVGGTNKINMNLGFTYDGLRVAFYAKNLTKEDTPEVVTRLADFRQFFFIPSQVRTSFFGRGTFARDFAVTPPRQREFGVSMSYDF